MKLFLILTLSAALVGCKITRGSLALPSGEKISVTDARFLLNTSAKLTWPTSNGPVTLDLSSNPASYAIEAAARGAVQGMK